MTNNSQLRQHVQIGTVYGDAVIQRVWRDDDGNAVKLAVYFHAKRNTRHGWYDGMEEILPEDVTEVKS